jgi:GNAT superfamily N-acetyltransferase
VTQSLSTSGAVVRLARVRDLPCVIAMWEQFHREIGRRYVPLVRLTQNNRRQITLHFEYLRKSRQLWLMWVADRPVGYAAAVPNLSPLELPFSSAAISDLYLMPEWRHCGLGRKLLVRVVRDIAARGLDAVTLTVAQGNPARELYRSIGFCAWEENMILPCTLPLQKRLSHLLERV